MRARMWRPRRGGALRGHALDAHPPFPPSRLPSPPPSRAIHSRASRYHARAPLRRIRRIRPRAIEIFPRHSAFPFFTTANSRDAKLWRGLRATHIHSAILIMNVIKYILRGSFPGSGHRKWYPTAKNDGARRIHKKKKKKRRASRRLHASPRRRAMARAPAQTPKNSKTELGFERGASRAL